VAPGLPVSRAPSLRRELGLFSAALLVVGGIIGSGIFFTPAETARALPTAGLVFLVWAVGGVVALAGALTYAELGAVMPDAGGAYVYIRDGFGKLPAFLYGWMALLSIGTGALAAVALGFAGYAGRFVDLTPFGGPVTVAAGTIALLTMTNYLGIKPGAIVQNVLAVAKIAALAALILGGLALWTSIGAPVPVPDAPPARESLVAGLATAFVAVLFTIGGWQQMNMVAGEIRDPARTIPRALALGIGIVIAIYLGANAVYLRALGRDGLAASTAVAADTATRLIGSAGGTFITVAAMLSILGFVNVVILATPRIFFAMAKDGVFLEAAARIHPRFGSPHISVLIMGGWAIALLALTGGEIGPLLSGVVFADWIFFGLGAASVFALRRSRPDAPRPYRAWGYPVVPAFFVVAAVFGIVSAYVAAPKTSLLGTGILAAGVLVYVARTRVLRGTAAG
jgi:APA family basic amino acid/polyamine antiporter